MAAKLPTNPGVAERLADALRMAARNYLPAGPEDRLGGGALRDANRIAASNRNLLGKYGLLVDGMLDRAAFDAALATLLPRRTFRVFGTRRVSSYVDVEATSTVEAARTAETHDFQPHSAEVLAKKGGA